MERRTVFIFNGNGSHTRTDGDIISEALVWWVDSDGEHLCVLNEVVVDDIYQHTLHLSTSPEPHGPVSDPVIPSLN